MKDIWRVGDPQKPEVAFGTLFDDDDVQQHYEGLAATLKAAKKRELYIYILILYDCSEAFISFCNFLKLVFLTYQTNHRGNCYI